MKLISETQRLQLAEMTVADAPFIFRLVNEPTWLKYIGDRKVYSLEDAERYLLAGSIKSYWDNGFGFYKVLLKDTGEPIGTCGLAKREYLDDVDLGFAFFPSFTGKGFAREAAEGVLAYAKQELGLSRLAAFTSVDNTASIQLLLKLGFHYAGPLMLEGEELNFYEKDL